MRVSNSNFYFISYLFFAFFMVRLTTGQIQQPQNLTYLTEEYPPYNYEENGKLKGISIDILEKIWKKMNCSLTRKDIQLVPWTRGYNELMTKKNIVLFSTGKTEERSTLFKWVGPIDENSLVLLALKTSNIKITQLKQIEQLKVGTINHDISEQTLLKNGINKACMSKSANIEIMIKNLSTGRLDLIALMKNTSNKNLTGYGFNPKDFEILYEFGKTQSHYAFSIAVSDSLINVFQQALDAIEKSGDRQKIVDSYYR